MANQTTLFCPAIFHKFSRQYGFINSPFDGLHQNSLFSPSQQILQIHGQDESVAARDA